MKDEVKLPLTVRVTVEDGVVQEVEVLDADGKPVEFIEEIEDLDE